MLHNKQKVNFRKLQLESIYEIYICSILANDFFRLVYSFSTGTDVDSTIEIANTK
jgi:hypothetical protein